MSGASALHHKIAYGRWEDEKPACHGKVGKWVFSGSLLVRLGCEVYEYFKESPEETVRTVRVEEEQSIVNLNTIERFLD